MENNNVREQRGIPFFKLIYKNLLLIVLITVLATLLGLGYGVISVKPTYTVDRSVILYTEINTNGSSSNNSNNLQVGKLYVSQVEYYITSSEYVSRANEILKEKYKSNPTKYKDVKFNADKNPIRTGAIKVSYNEQSVIFKIAYKDADKYVAAEKLDAIYQAANEKLTSSMNAMNVKLIDTDDIDMQTYKGLGLSVDNGFAKCIIFGALIGLGVAIIIVLLKYALDNTVRDKAEIEEMTGVNVIAYIQKEKNKK